jgi:hypothetical protein
MHNKTQIQNQQDNNQKVSEIKNKKLEQLKKNTQKTNDMYNVNMGDEDLVGHK